MTRTPYDQFAKQYLAGLLQPLGTTQVSQEVAAEVRQVDLWFVPSEHPPDLESLGVLGQLVALPCAIEPFRNPIQLIDVRTCLSKLLDLQAGFHRDAKRDRQRIPEANLPKLWILSPSISQRILTGFSATASTHYGTGVYELAPALHTGLVALNRLPRTPETLWLRLMGRGSVQRAAIEDLMTLPREHPWRYHAFEQLVQLRILLQARQNLNSEEQEVMMNLSAVYDQWLEETLAKGRSEGLREGRSEGLREGRSEGLQEGRSQGLQEGRSEGRIETAQEDIEGLLEFRFGELDPQLMAIARPLIDVPARERIRLILQLSREELLARFSPDM